MLESVFMDILYKWSYIIFVVGLCMLILFFEIYSPDMMDMERVLELGVGEDFKFIGKVRGVREYSKMVEFEMERICDVSVVMFSDGKTNYSVP